MGKRLCIAQCRSKCRILLPHSLCPSPCMQDGETALMKAALKGHGDIVKLLLESGAQKDLQNEVRRREGCGAAPMGAMRRGGRLYVGVRVQIGNGVGNRVAGQYCGLGEIG